MLSVGIPGALRANSPACLKAAGMVKPACLVRLALALDTASSAHHPKESPQELGLVGQNPLDGLQCPVRLRKGVGGQPWGQSQLWGSLPPPEVTPQTLLALMTRCPSHLPGAKVKGPAGCDPDPVL